MPGPNPKRQADHDTERRLSTERLAKLPRQPPPPPMPPVQPSEAFRSFIVFLLIQGTLLDCDVCLFGAKEPADYSTGATIATATNYMPVDTGAPPLLFTMPAASGNSAWCKLLSTWFCALYSARGHMSTACPAVPVAYDVRSRWSIANSCPGEEHARAAFN